METSQILSYKRPLCALKEYIAPGRVNQERLAKCSYEVVSVWPKLKVIPHQTGKAWAGFWVETLHDSHVSNG